MGSNELGLLCGGNWRCGYIQGTASRRSNNTTDTFREGSMPCKPWCSSMDSNSDSTSPERQSEPPPD